jgi:hypothetical protein
MTRIAANELRSTIERDQLACDRTAHCGACVAWKAAEEVVIRVILTQQDHDVVDGRRGCARRGDAPAGRDVGADPHCGSGDQRHQQKDCNSLHQGVGFFISIQPGVNFTGVSCEGRYSFMQKEGSMASSEHTSSLDAATLRGTGRRFALPGGIAGNAQLTSLVGIVLLVLFFVEGLTLLSKRALLPIHIFVGLLIIPPLLLKLAGVGYRFVRYYTGNAEYRRAGPPQPLLRAIAPILVLTTAGIFATGVAMLVPGVGRLDTLRSLHTLSFVVWIPVMTVHVLRYALPAGLGSWHGLFGSRAHEIIAGRLTRQSFVAGSLLLGLVLAVAMIPLGAPLEHFRHG